MTGHGVEAYVSADVDERSGALGANARDLADRHEPVEFAPPEAEQAGALAVWFRAWGRPHGQTSTAHDDVDVGAVGGTAASLVAGSG